MQRRTAVIVIATIIVLALVALLAVNPTEGIQFIVLNGEQQFAVPCVIFKDKPRVYVREVLDFLGFESEERNEFVYCNGFVVNPKPPPVGEKVILGDERFQKTIEEAATLLEKTVPEYYPLYQDYVGRVRQSDDKNMSAPALTDENEIVIKWPEFLDIEKKSDHKTMIQILATILCHESVHSYLYRTGIAYVIDAASNEAIAGCHEYYVATKLGLNPEHVNFKTLYDHFQWEVQPLWADTSKNVLTKPGP